MVIFQTNFSLHYIELSYIFINSIARKGAFETEIKYNAPFNCEQGS